jgi:hypothetical protein
MDRLQLAAQAAMQAVELRSIAPARPEAVSSAD